MPTITNESSHANPRTIHWLASGFPSLVSIIPGICISYSTGILVKFFYGKSRNELAADFYGIPKLYPNTGRWSVLAKSVEYQHIYHQFRDGRNGSGNGDRPRPQSNLSGQRTSQNHCDFAVGLADGFDWLSLDLDF